jgi:hypothetical protein
MKKRTPTYPEMILSIILVLAQIFYATTVNPEPKLTQSCPVVSTQPIVDRKVLNDETDRRFHLKHPELRGRKLTPNDDESLLEEWRQIRLQLQDNVFERTD